MSDSLWSHESQHARPPRPSPSPGVHSDPCPSSLWCHPAISSSVVPFSSCPQSLPASESFPMSQLFAWGGQSTGVSALASFLPKKSQGLLVNNCIPCSVQFSHSVLSDSLWAHGLQQNRPPCPSLSPGVYSNPCPLSRWCHPTISSSVLPFSSCPQSFPASGSFQMSQFFAAGDQSVGVSASMSVLPVNTQDGSPLGWTGWISL